MPARFVTILCAFVLFAGAVFSQFRANSAREAAGGEDILYLPNQKLLNHFTGGLNNVVADLLWLRCIQYVGTESKGDRSFTWLQQMLDTVVQLDPYFGDAYRYGGMFLAALKADDDAGIELLERGFIANPDNFQLPYELAMIFLLNRKDEPGARERAAHYLSMAASIEDCPAFIRDLAVKLQGQYNLVDVEREMWERVASSGDKLLRETANRKLVELDIRQVTENLNKAALVFQQRTGRFPGSLEEMAEAGIVQPIGADPLGGRFFVGEDGVIRNTTTLDEQQNSALSILRKQLDSFHDKNGRWPESLEELVSSGTATKVPPHPYPGQAWDYDAATGIVR